MSAAATGVKGVKVVSNSPTVVQNCGDFSVLAGILEKAIDNIAAVQSSSDELQAEQRLSHSCGFGYGFV